MNTWLGGILSVISDLRTGIVDGRCATVGFLNFLRLLGLVCIFLQPAVTYITFLVYFKSQGSGKSKLLQVHQNTK